MDLLPAETMANAVTLTGSWAAIGAAMRCDQASSIALMLYYSAGTGGTSPALNYVIEGAIHDSPSAWVALEEVLDTTGTPSGGVLTAPSSRLVRTLSATDGRAVIVDVRGFAWVRVRAYESGSPSPYGALTVVGRGRIGDG